MDADLDLLLTVVCRIADDFLPAELAEVDRLSPCAAILRYGDEGPGRVSIG